MTNHPLEHLGVFREPVLIFGGPYGNLQATQAMQQIAQQRGIPAERVICNGDCAAYCAQPEQTVQLIREWGIPVLLGNCEESLAAQASDCGCGFEAGSHCSLLADDWYPFCSQQLSAASKAWMGDLPGGLIFEIHQIRFRLVHGALSAINRFIFASTPAEEKRKELALSGADVVIGGHSGIPFGQRLGRNYWLNSGVIGMPANDGTQAGWYLLLTPEAKGVRCDWHRLHYDAQAARQAMADAQRLDGYARTLIDGLWPSMDILPETERNARGQALSPQSIALPYRSHADPLEETHVPARQN